MNAALDAAIGDEERRDEDALPFARGPLHLIFTFGPISGAHFNPAVSLAAALEGGFPWRRVPGYVAAQTTGALAGVVAAHIMFEHALVSPSPRSRAGGAQLFSEFVATFGLLVVIHGTGKRAAVVPLTVAAYLTAAYRSTSNERRGDRGVKERVLFLCTDDW